VEAANSPSHDPARDPGRCHDRRAEIRALFTRATGRDGSIGSHDVSRARCSR
jgi:hypothetical protein